MKDCSFFDGIAWDNYVRTKLDKVKENDWLRKGDILLATRGQQFQQSLPLTYSEPRKRKKNYAEIIFRPSRKPTKPILM